MAMESADVSDISNSPAYQSLDELVASGKLTQPQAQLYRSKYAKLHEVVLKTYENEKNLLKKAKLLNQDLTAEKGKLEKTAAQAQEDSEAIAGLRAEMAKGENELSLREERELLLQQEVHELASSKTELAADVQTTQRRQAAELQPQIDALEAAVDEARTELGKHKANLAKLTKERDEGAERAQLLRQEKSDVETQKMQLNAQMVKVKSEPEKNKKAADVVMVAAQSLESEAAKLVDQLGFLDSELASQSKKRKEIEEERMGLAMAVRLRPPSAARRRPSSPPLALNHSPRRAAPQVERHRSAIEQKERVADEIRKNIELAKEETVRAILRNSAQFSRNSWRTSPTPCAFPSAGEFARGARADRVRDEGGAVGREARAGHAQPAAEGLLDLAQESEARRAAAGEHAVPRAVHEAPDRGREPAGGRAEGRGEAAGGGGGGGAPRGRRLHQQLPEAGGARGRESRVGARRRRRGEESRGGGGRGGEGGARPAQDRRTAQRGARDRGEEGGEGDARREGGE